MSKMTLLLITTTISIGITGAAVCVGVTYLFSAFSLNELLNNL
jgi:hypothetical protein